MPARPRHTRFLFANTEGKEVTVVAKIDRDLYGISGEGWRTRVFSGFGRNGYSALENGPIGTEKIILLTLPVPLRKVVMVEFYSPSPPNLQ